MMRLVKLFILMFCLLGIVYVVTADEKASLAMLSSQLLERGQKALEEKNYSQAILLLEQSIVADHENPRAFASLGDAYRDAGNRQRAHLYYKRALERDPNALGVLYQQALLWILDEENIAKATNNLERMEILCSYCPETLSLMRAFSNKDDGS